MDRGGNRLQALCRWRALICPADLRRRPSLLLQRSSAGGHDLMHLLSRSFSWRCDAAQCSRLGDFSASFGGCRRKRPCLSCIVAHLSEGTKQIPTYRLGDVFFYAFGSSMQQKNGLLHDRSRTKERSQAVPFTDQYARWRSARNRVAVHRCVYVRACVRAWERTANERKKRMACEQSGLRPPMTILWRFSRLRDHASSFSAVNQVGIMNTSSAEWTCSQE